MMKTFFENNKKYMLKSLILVGISLLLSLVFYLVKRLPNSFSNFLFVITFLILAFCFIYFNNKSNKIRKRTKNWAGEFTNEEKMTYIPTVRVCLFACLFNMIIYLIIYISKLAF